MTVDLKAHGVIPFYRSGENLLYLLLLQESGWWSFPKGAPEENETELETALRELSEETGITEVKIVPDKFFKVSYVAKYSDGECNKEVTLFVGEVENQTVSIQEGEILDYKWISGGEIRTFNVHENIEILLEKVHKYLTYEHTKIT